MELTEIRREGSRKSEYGVTPPATDNDIPVVEPRTKAQINKARVQFLTLCWTLFLAGWNDGSTGPLLPRIREVYHVGFTIVSLLFVLACIVRFDFLIFASFNV
jgi:hypothetical protein